MKKPLPHDGAVCGLEPLIDYSLYSELLNPGFTPKFVPEINDYAYLITDRDGKKLSTDAETLFRNAPELLFATVRYLQQPSPETLETMKSAVAMALGIRGWARSDYEVKDERVGL